MDCSPQFTAGQYMTPTVKSLTRDGTMSEADCLPSMTTMLFRLWNTASCWVS